MKDEQFGDDEPLTSATSEGQVSEEQNEKNIQEKKENENRNEDTTSKEEEEDECSEVESEEESEESKNAEETILEEEKGPFVLLEDEMWSEMEEEGYKLEEGSGEGEGELGETVEEGAEIEEGPPDPAAPYNLTDSSEALKAPFALREDQLAEVEALWALFQDYTPAYTEIDGYVTERELVYMLKSLNLMTFTPEQLMELIIFCVRPPHPDNHVTYEQFVHIVTIRQRDMPVEEEIRLAVEVFDPDSTGLVDREYLRDQLSTTGYKMKNVDNFIKEVDMSNDGTLGIDDIVGTMCIDLNRDDIMMLYDQIKPPEERNDNIDNLI